ncbi:MAG: hypothetical protein HN608_17530 [Rhodospirillaceae bacterium]|jgi:hypothetical protein|nr:hypothetical protein [Rhodospirillaceae bacterium]
MHIPHISIANLTRFTVKFRAYMSAIIDRSTHAHKGSFAMNTNLNNTSMAPHSVLVSIVNDLIAPIAFVISTAIVALLFRHKKAGNETTMKLAATQAPHVAMVMVPGNFVTEPFSHR